MDISKQQFLDMLSRPETLNEDEVQDLEMLVMKYPYFQLGYSLIAKAKYDHQSPDAYDLLAKASVYAPDRSVLKQIFYDNLHIDYTFQDYESDTIATAADADFQSDYDNTSSDFTLTEDQPEEFTESSYEEPVSDVHEDTFQQEEVEEPYQAMVDETDPELNQAVDSDLESESQFETNADLEAEEIKEDMHISSEHEMPAIENSELSNEVEPEPPAVQNNESVYDELQANLESLRKNMLKFDDEENAVENSTDTESGKKKTIDENQEADSDVNQDNFVSKDVEKITFGNKQHDQFRIIEKFISNDDNHVIIAKRPEKEKETQKDLSETSTIYRDTPITENFAVIMEKQGKIDKAVEIYKKLIWKFPQKKTYFADKIKELTEKE